MTFKGLHVYKRTFIEGFWKLIELEGSEKIQSEADHFLGNKLMPLTMVAYPEQADAWNAYVEEQRVHGFPTG